MTVPDSITDFGNSAFSGCSSITNIPIPDDVASLGSYAFYGCTDLKSITIPESVASIGSYAFYKCSSLSSIVLPSKITSIQKYAFAYCSSLSSISIPAKVNGIAEYAFAGCTNVNEVMLPVSIANVGISDRAFYDCGSITDVYFAGSEAEAENIYISETGNSCLTKAEWHYNSELAAKDDGSEDESTVYYTVTYNGCGVADIPSIYVPENGYAYRPSADMTRSGYNFLGWYNGDGEWNFFTEVTEDITLTAKWEDEEKVTILSNGAVLDADGAHVVLVGATVSLTPADIAAYSTIASVSWSDLPSGMSIADSTSTTRIVTPTKAGLYTITAVVTSTYTYYDSLLKQNVTVSSVDYATYNIRAVDLISEITVDSEVNMAPGRSMPLNYTTTPSGNYAKTMSGFYINSSDTSVVTVSDDGILTAVGTGTATIVLYTITGDTSKNLIKTCTVTVAEPEEPAETDPTASETEAQESTLPQESSESQASSTTAAEASTESFATTIAVATEESDTQTVCIVGDVSLDGKITVSDATAIQKFVVGSQSFSDEQFALADANGDGSVTVADATAVQKMVVGIA